MTIVDDSVILVGSANINQRSLDGTRDSELLNAFWQCNHLATPDKLPDGDVHAFRLHCFARIMNSMEDIFRDPSSNECMRRINEIALENWRLYVHDEVCEMDSFLVPYPYKVSEKDGSLAPLTDNGFFPNTVAPIMGNPGKLPKVLTT